MAALITLTLLTLTGPKRGWVRRWLPLVWIAMAPLGLWLLAGGLGLLPVGTRSWGGLTLTLLLLRQWSFGASVGDPPGPRPAQ